jgi:hypothetical protein
MKDMLSAKMRRILALSARFSALANLAGVAAFPVALLSPWVLLWTNFWYELPLHRRGKSGKSS